MELNKLAMISITLSFFLFNSPNLVGSQEVENEHEFSYDEHDNKQGPEQWGKIHKEWDACGKGRMQSPIDLSDEHVDANSDLGRLKRFYRPAPAILKNRGHDIMLKWEGDTGSMWINGTKYPLKQLHWHSPSEHTVNGHRYSLEMHMVHETADNKIAVVAILYTIGQPDPLLAKMEDSIKKLEDMKEKEEKVGRVDPRRVITGNRQYYRYIGSLTIPPCTEGVVWTIVKKVRTVSKEQMHLLRKAVHDDFEENARPVQEINERRVDLYQPKKVKY